MQLLRNEIESSSYQWQNFCSKHKNFVQQTKLIYPDIKLSEAIYIHLYNKGLCAHCQSQTTFINIKKGYRECCSLECSNKLKKNREKKAATLKNKTEIEKTTIKQKKQTTLKKHSKIENDIIYQNRVNGHKKRNINQEVMRREKIKDWWRSMGTETRNSLISSRKKARLVHFYDELINRVAETVKPLFTKDEFIGVDHTIKYKWQCLKCDTVFKDDCDDGKLPRCKKCHPLNNSLKEQALYEFILTLCPDAQNRRRDIIPPKEIDIFIPSLNIGIEFCGLYWHSDEFLEKTYHYNKYKACLDKNIHLITIFEDQWDNKPNVIKSRLKAILGKNKRIYARKTTIKELSNCEARPFLESTHIQGYVSAQKSYGLFFNNTLVALMSFSNDRYNKNNSYELLRYCSTDTVVGGASKLLSKFKKDCEPNSIVTYADRCWSMGNLYNKLGFTDITRQENNVGYYLISPAGIRYHRSSFQKKKLVKQGYSSEKTQTEIMKERKFKIVWNCGNMKFRWEK